MSLLVKSAQTAHNGAAAEVPTRVDAWPGPTYYPPRLRWRVRRGGTGDDRSRAVIKRLRHLADS